jgi:outer membrane protein assembly factor BamB
MPSSGSRRIAPPSNKLVALVSFRGKATATAGFVVCVAAILGVLSFAAATAAAEPVTASNDALRTGWYPDEPQLSPAAVAGGSFGQLFETPIEGQVYAQPLVSNGTLLVATEDNWIYGLDPASGAVKWSRNVGTPFLAAEIPGCTDLVPNVGVTGTPVIDPDTGTAYFYAKTYSPLTALPIWQLHAVNMAGGAEAPGFPVTISGNAENITHPKFDAKQELQRPALLLMNGVVYAGFGSHCDNRPYQGWLVGVSTAGQVRTMFATGPDGSAIWQAGGGLISDGTNQILFATGNSFGPTPPDSPTPPSDLGEAVARVQVGPTGATTTTDFFSPFNREELDELDLDLGSSAPTALPSNYFGTPAVPNLMLVGGKEHKIFVLDRDDLGGQGQGPGGTNGVVEQIENAHAVFGSMAVWPGQGGYVYVPGIGFGSGGGVEVLRYGTEGEKPKFTLVGQTPDPLAFGSGSPIVTSDGTTPGSAVVWVPRCPSSGTCEGSTLDAYRAVPAEGQAPIWQAPIGIAPKFGRPGVADGRVYVGTMDGRVIGFGLPSEPAGPAPGGGGGGNSTGEPGQGAPGGSSEPPRPGTRLTRASLRPAIGKATFRFASEPGAVFECRLLRTSKPAARNATPRFRRCASPKAYRHLRPGPYRFEVRAANATGPDRSPARRHFAF